MNTQNSEAKKAYNAPEMTDFGTLAQVVLNLHDTGSGDDGTDHGGDDSGWVADETLSY